MEPYTDSQSFLKYTMLDHVAVVLSMSQLVTTAAAPVIPVLDVTTPFTCIAYSWHHEMEAVEHDLHNGGFLFDCDAII